MSTRRAFGHDSGLQARMMLTVLLLGAVYAALLAALFASGASGLVIVLVGAGLFLLQAFTSDKVALAAAGACEVTPAQAPELHALVERLCR